jgi:enterochelin esterase family protein
MTSKNKVIFRIAFLLLLVFCSFNIQAQQLTPSLLVDLLSKQVSSEDRERLITSLSEKRMIPFTNKDSCLFVYVGEATSVQWNGDFNAWSGDPSFNNTGELIGENIWILKSSFPSDARMDYKVVVDGNWILDPLNPHQQWTGMGGGAPNSELRMPQWSPDPFTIEKEDVDTGEIKEYELQSEKLNRRVSYSIYYPRDYLESQSYPVLYFTDGHEYLDNRIGATQTVLNNLIHEAKIPPVVAVFFDPRDPGNNLENLRMKEYALNKDFLNFFISELIPEVEDSLGINIKVQARVIIGTSLGGLNATYFGVSLPDYFPLLGIQSPAFQYKPEIFELVENYGGEPLKIYMSSGTINDTEVVSKRMGEIMNNKGFELKLQMVNEGHSWGNWKALLDDMLIFLLANTSVK